MKNEELLNIIVSNIKEQSDRFDERLDIVNQRLSSIDSTQIKQQASLDEHIRRTEINEKAIESIKQRVSPLEKHVNMWAGAGKVLAIASIFAGIAVAIYKITH